MHIFSSNKIRGEEKTPIIRKVIQVGTSRAVTLPKSWLANAEEKAGRKIVVVALEVNNVITIAPIFEKEPIESDMRREVDFNG